jgi:hypothetical protein
VKPQGGYVVFWGEEEEKLEAYSVAPKHYYCRIVDVHGKMIVNRKELSFWYVPPHPVFFGVSFNSQTILWKDPDTLIILAWESFDHTHKMVRFVMNSVGEFIAGPDAAKEDAVGPSALLIADSKGNVFAVDCTIGSEWCASIMQVYPSFGKVSKVAAREGILNALLTTDNTACFTSNDEILFCYRVANLDKPTLTEIPEGWVGLPNHLFVFITDSEGDIVVEGKTIDLKTSSFRKLPGIHLGGNYGSGYYAGRLMKTASEDLDISRLPNGEIILSATGLDDAGDLCVYQVKYTANGTHVMPDSQEITRPISFPDSELLPVQKVLSSTTGLGEIPGESKVRIRREFVLIGYDTYGNFYERREIWREECK